MIEHDLLIDKSRTSCLRPELKQNIVTGNLLDSESKEGLGSSGLLTPQPLPEYSEFPLNHARIGYQNILTDSDVSYSVVGGDAGGQDTIVGLLNPATWDKWRMPGLNAGDCRFVWSDLKEIDYFGIASHNAGTSGAAIRVYTSTNQGVTWQLKYNLSPENNNAIYLRFNKEEINGLRLTMSENSVDNEMGVFFAGVELQMMRPTYGGHSPSVLSATDVTTPQISDGGQFMGKQVVRRGYGTKASFKNLTNEWYREYFQPFVEHAIDKPYFWAWNPLESPSDVVYGWTNENMKPSMMGIRNWIQIDFNIEAHG